jgi:hypothetical protein
MQGTEHPPSLFKSVRQQKSNMCNSLTCTQTSYKEAPTRVQDFWLGSDTRCTRVQLHRRSGQLHHTRDYSSSGLHRLYYAYVVHPDAPSRRSTSRRSLTLALAVRPVTASRGATTRRTDCTGSTTPMPCIQMRRLAARLLVGRSHWLSQCVRSPRLAARLLVVQIAPALLRLCRASRRAVSPLDFSSVGRTGSRRASGHCASRRDYSSSGLHRLYCAYAVHPDTPSRRSTSRQSVALLSPCARLFRCAS